MDIQATKIALAKVILETNDESLIAKLSQFLQKEKADFWIDLSFEEQEEIKHGIEELNQGKRISFQDFLNKLD